MNRACTTACILQNCGAVPPTRRSKLPTVCCFCGSVISDLTMSGLTVWLQSFGFWKILQQVISFICIFLDVRLRVNPTAPGEHGNNSRACKTPICRLSHPTFAKITSKDSDISPVPSCFVAPVLFEIPLAPPDLNAGRSPPVTSREERKPSTDGLRIQRPRVLFLHDRR